jgi:hypothetical protein
MLGVRGEGDDATLESVDRSALLVLTSLHTEPSISIGPNKGGSSSVASLVVLRSRKRHHGHSSSGSFEKQSISVWGMSAVESCLPWTLRITAE